MQKKKFSRLIVLMMFTLSASSQCPLVNKAFTSGEFLSYNLYYNWKFVWVKVGTASLSTVLTRYDGQQAYKSSLITRGNGKLDKFFVMRDTLLGYVTPSLSPLYFRKGAVEGKRYRVDEVWYSYKNGKCKVKMHRQKSDRSHIRSEKTSEQCVYDMLNIFTRARNFDPAGLKKGHTVKIPVADGNGMTVAILKYEGKEKVQGDNGVKYNCLKLAYSEWEEKNSKYRQYATFFVTDDDNHIPVRIDITLNFGIAKAFVTSMKGIKNKAATL